MHEIPTAEWAVAVVLAMQKCPPFFLSMQSIGKWGRGSKPNNNDASLPTRIKDPPAPIRDVAGTTVLIVGYGSIGKAVEARLTPFGAKYLRVARAQRNGVASVNQLDDLLGRSRHRTADRALDVRNKGHDRCAANRENEAGSLAGERCPRSTGRHRSPAGSFCRPGEFAPPST